MMDEQKQHEYFAAVTRAFDDPGDPDARSTALVFGDMLQAAGDSRGELIAIAGALARTRDRGRRRDIAAALDAHLTAHQHHLLGAIGWLRQVRRAITLEWRAGYIYAARLDARQVRKTHAVIRPYELVGMLLSAPAARFLRRLEVRVKRRWELAPIWLLLKKGSYVGASIPIPPPPLEQILLLTESRPRYLGARGDSVFAPSPFRSLRVVTEVFDGSEVDRMNPPLKLSPRGADGLRGVFRTVQMLGIVDRIWPVGLGDDALSLVGKVSELAAREPAEVMRDAPSRTLLGRALWAHQEALRGAALAVIAGLGRHAVSFLPSLVLMLRPSFLASQIPVIECLAALGPDAADASLALARITPQKQRYDAATRSAAGKALARIRPDLR